MITLSAPAKINLTLEVLGRGPDGYHTLASVMQTISLADTLTFELADELELECSDPSLQNQENLVFRAASLLRERLGERRGARMHLVKSIPVGAGLGGGSSAAAATLRALPRLWGQHLPQASLEGVAKSLGSDVPFFLVGGTALVSGRGDRVVPLPSLPLTWFVVLPEEDRRPGKTARLYEALTPQDYGSGAHTAALVNALRCGAAVADHICCNGFQAVAERLFPHLPQRRRRFAQLAGRKVHLVGSGPSLFALVPDEEAGRRLVGALQGAGLHSYLVSSVPGVQEPGPGER